MNKILYTLLTLAVAATANSVNAQNNNQVEQFPYNPPTQKPNYEMSAAMNRYYDQFDGKQPNENELYSQFKYTDLKGFDYNNFDGTISRRDPSRIIFHNGKYYMWYTYRNTPTPPVGAELCDEVKPSADWDLAEIWYATSADGFTWEEQGVAVPRPKAPELGCRAVSTCEIIEWEGKWYLYYQAFNKPSGTRGDDCPVSVSVATSPDGPWVATGRVIVENGPEGAWDQYSIHDPHPLIHDGKVYLYYKSDFNDNQLLTRMQGLAIADNPLGPFEKHPLNPILNSGHETGIFPFGKGVAALVYKDGPEHNTIQYAEDWVNFEIVAISELFPYAASFYIPDEGQENPNATGVTWGMAHFINYIKRWDKQASKLVRFDCDLSTDVNDTKMKQHRVQHDPQVYYDQKLDKEQLKRINEETERIRRKAEDK
ncbi:MAG: family 43 glycosylhydrolase [Rikenellaceae bacterium]